MEELQCGQRLGFALVKNIKLTYGDQELRCGCTDLKCPVNSHKVELKRKYLSSIFANDVEEKEGIFKHVQTTFWMTHNGEFSRTRENQEKYDMEQEKILIDLGYKSMDIESLRKMYESLSGNIKIVKLHPQSDISEPEPSS